MNANDPLALIIAGGAAALSMLLGFVVALVSARNKRNEDEIKSSGDHINQLVVEGVEAKGRLRVCEAEISALKTQTLSREIFDHATREQNSKLDSVQQKLQETSVKVDNIDRGLIARTGYSQDNMPAVRVPPTGYRKPGGGE
jgi:hypothetical protein